MDILQAIQARHSVRAYTEQKIDADVRIMLDAFVMECNTESGLNIRVVYDNPDGFDSRLAHYGNFRNVNNFIVVKGADCSDFDEKCGYFGEKIVIRAQQLGLNTCWVAMTFNKRVVKKMIPDGEKLCMVIALGYGQDQGKERKSKSVDQVTATKGKMPDWFKAGVEAALLAPTAMNQQKFVIGIIDGEPALRVAGRGFCTKVDLGIAKYHFEAASGRAVK